MYIARCKPLLGVPGDLAKEQGRGGAVDASQEAELGSPSRCGALPGEKRYEPNRAFGCVGEMRQVLRRKKMEENRGGGEIAL